MGTLDLQGTSSADNGRSGVVLRYISGCYARCLDLPACFKFVLAFR